MAVKVGVRGPGHLSRSGSFYPDATLALDFVGGLYRVGAGNTGSSDFSSLPGLTLANSPTIDSNGITFNGTNQSAVITGVTNATPCTLFMELVTLTGTDFRHFMNWTDGTASNRVGGYWAFTDNAQFAVAGGVDATGSPKAPGTASVGAVTKLAMMLNGTTLRAFGGGAQSTDMTLGSAISLTTLTLGREPAFSFWNGRIRKLIIWPRALTDAELIALTT